MITSGRTLRALAHIVLAVAAIALIGCYAQASAIPRPEPCRIEVIARVVSGATEAECISSGWALPNLTASSSDNNNALEPIKSATTDASGKATFTAYQSSWNVTLPQTVTYVGQTYSARNPSSASVQVTTSGTGLTFTRYICYQEVEPSPN